MQYNQSFDSQFICRNANQIFLSYVCNSGLAEKNNNSRMMFMRKKRFNHRLWSSFAVKKYPKFKHLHSHRNLFTIWSLSNLVNHHCIGFILHMNIMQISASIKFIQTYWWEIQWIKISFIDVLPHHINWFKIQNINFLHVYCSYCDLHCVLTVWKKQKWRHFCGMYKNLSCKLKEK